MTQNGQRHSFCDGTKSTWFTLGACSTYNVLQNLGNDRRTTAADAADVNLTSPSIAHLCIQVVFKVSKKYRVHDSSVLLSILNQWPKQYRFVLVNQRCNKISLHRYWRSPRDGPSPLFKYPLTSVEFKGTGRK